MTTHTITALPRRSKLAVMKARVDTAIRTNPNAFIASRVAIMAVSAGTMYAISKTLEKMWAEDETSETPEA